MSDQEQGLVPTISMRDWVIVPRQTFRSTYLGFGFRILGILVHHPKYTDQELFEEIHWWHSTEVTDGTEECFLTSNGSCYSLVGQSTGIRRNITSANRQFLPKEVEDLKRYVDSDKVPAVIRSALSLLIQELSQDEGVTSVKNPIPSPIPPPKVRIHAVR
jgi:hypothetical protein